MKILTWITESDYLFYSMAVFDDDQIDLFNRSFREGFSCPDSKSKESDFAICLETLWIGTTYNNFTAFKIYPEISGGWNRVSQEKFDSYRKIASWVWKCFQWSGTFYKIVPVSQMLKLVNINKDVHISKGKPTPNATKFWITKSGKCLLANNNSDYSIKTLNYLSKAIEANADLVIEKWLSFFGEILYYC